MIKKEVETVTREKTEKNTYLQHRYKNKLLLF